MADQQYVKIYLIRAKISTRGLSKSLIMKPLKNFKINNRRSNMVGRYVKIYFIQVQIGTLEVFLRDLLSFFVRISLPRCSLLYKLNLFLVWEIEKKITLSNRH